MKLAEHPTAKAFYRRAKVDHGTDRKLDIDWLRQLCLDEGADDVGFVEIGRPTLDDQRADILRYFPRARSLISIVCRMNREPIRSTARTVANLEFHQATDEVNEVARSVVARLEEHGVRAMNPSA